MTRIVLYLHGDVFRQHFLHWMTKYIEEALPTKERVPSACGIQTCISRQPAVRSQCLGREGGRDWIAAPVPSSSGRGQVPGCTPQAPPAVFREAMKPADFKGSRVQRSFFIYTAACLRPPSNLAKAWSTGRILCSEEGCMLLKNVKRFHKFRLCCIILLKWWRIYEESSFIACKFYIAYVLHNFWQFMLILQIRFLLFFSGMNMKFT